MEQNPGPQVGRLNWPLSLAQRRSGQRCAGLATPVTQNTPGACCANVRSAAYLVFPHRNPVSLEDGCFALRREGDRVLGS